ncbi:MAG: hypothetical protein KGD70_07020, partial [Candidatus Lokiarchaeota archaeon]|nr:hypothetical protein [Candidatus Lokiarchaeota archaeon]
LPSPKKTKRKLPVDENQKSLFSFVEKTEDKKEEKSKSTTKEEKKELEGQEFPHEPPEIDEVKEEIKVKEEPTLKIPPKKQYFTGSSIPFGLKDEGIKLQYLNRESVSSKYLRYLIEKGEIVEDLE